MQATAGERRANTSRDLGEIFIYGVYPHGRMFAVNKYYYFYVYQV